MSERKTMFGEAKHKKYADIVSLETPSKAKMSVAKLIDEFDKAKTRSKKVRIKRVTVNASNRARASWLRKGLSRSEKLQFLWIHKIYRNAYEKRMIIPSLHARKR